MGEEIEEIRKFFNAICKVEDEVLDAYFSNWKPHVVAKRNLITAPGDTERYLYFVLQGIQKSYYLHDDKFHVIAFTYPPSFSGIPESFITQTPSKYYLETLTDSRFLRIRFDKHTELLQEHRSIETLFRIATEKLLIGVIERHFELMAYDIETRFKKFAERSPHLLNMVSQKDLASYLRIDATNFSKLLNSIRI